MSVSIEALKETARRCRVEIVKMVYQVSKQVIQEDLCQKLILLQDCTRHRFEYVPMILIGMIETDSSFPKDTHLLVCTQFWPKRDLFRMRI